MTRAWRITKAKYANNAFDGEGARLYGGRWSSPGTRVVYVADSLALATLEILVHLQNTRTLADYVVFRSDFSAESVQILPEGDWPNRWRAYPSPADVQAVGDRWIRAARTPLLRVPSAVIPQECNYLLNPAHADFTRIAIAGPFPLDIDPRLLKS
jgi:RES domain-containing protein